jgi:DNA-binding MarR family transcriptional regulator
MADISRKRAEKTGNSQRTPAPAAAPELPSSASPQTAIDHITLIELLFFGYRDFTGESDAILAEFNLGRAHHRVLHFVMRQPGLRVADLLAILKITKQSLARVLSPLINDGWIDSRPGPADRRERLLFVTDRGANLVARLVRHQSEQIANALAAMPGDGDDVCNREAIIHRFLFAMISPDERAKVASLLKLTPTVSADRSA